MGRVEWQSGKTYAGKTKMPSKNTVLFKNVPFPRNVPPWARGLAVLCVTLTIFLGLAFFSYQPDATDSNQVGRAGYLVAHVLCRAFGLTAYLFPALLLYAMALRFHWLRCVAPFVQGISFVVFTLATSAFLALWFDGQPVFQAGGWIGSFLALHLRQAGNLVGAYLLLFPVLLVSFMGTTQLSLVKLGSGLATGGRALGRFGWSRLRALSGLVAGQLSGRLEQLATRWTARRTERQTPPSEPVFCGGEEAEVYTPQKKGAAVSSAAKEENAPTGA